MLSLVQRHQVLLLRLALYHKNRGSFADTFRVRRDDLTVDAKGTKKFVFRTTFKDSYQGKVLAAYSYNNLNAKKVVLYYDNASDYAKGIAG